MNKQLKSAFTALVLLIGVQSAGQAQEVEYGVKAGALYNMPGYGHQAVSHGGRSFGIQAGVFARNASGRLYVQGELTFSSFKSGYTFQQKKYSPTFYQLNVPVQVGYKIMDTGKMKLRAAIGPQINYNLKEEHATDNSSFKPFTYDGFANIGTDIRHFTVDLRYNHSISRTSKDLDSRNRIIGLSVGYKF